MSNFRTIRNAAVIFAIVTISSCTRGQEKCILSGNFAHSSTEMVLFQPGLLLSVSNLVFDTYYTRLYGMKDLELVSGFVVIPFENSRAGFSVSTFGRKLYSETDLKFLYIRRLFQSLHLSGEVRYLSLSINGFSQRDDYSVCAGIYYTLSLFQIGARVLNFVSGGNAYTGILRNPGYQVVTVLQLTRKFLLKAGVLLHEDYPSMSVFESRLLLSKMFTIVVSSGQNPFTYSAGFEISRNRFCFMYHIKHHTDLGNTSQFGIRIMFKR